MTRTVDELREIYLASVKAAYPDLRTGPSTMPYAEAGGTALVFSGMVPTLAQIENNRVPGTADEIGVTQWSTALGVPRKGASPSFKAASLLISGTDGALVPLNAVLTYQEMQFKTASTATVVDGFALVSCESITVGPETKLPAGTELRFTSPPAGLSASARLILNLDEGGDPVEPVGYWRQRVALKLRGKAIGSGEGGHPDDYLRWALEYPSATEAWIYPKYRGRGTVAVIVGRAAQYENRLLSPAEALAFETHMDALKPLGDEILFLSPTATRVHVTASLEWFPGVEWDWDDNGGIVITAYDAATRTLSLSTSAVVPANALLTVSSQDPDASGATGRLCRCAVQPSSTSISLTSIDDAPPLDFLPQAGDLVFASCEEALDLRQRLLDGTEDLPGLHRLGPANPGGMFGAWLSDVDSSVCAALLLSSSVYSLSVTVSGPDPLRYTPVIQPFPDDLMVEWLIPGQVIVRGGA